MNESMDNPFVNSAMAKAFIENSLEVLWKLGCHRAYLITNHDRPQ